MKRIALLLSVSSFAVASAATAQTTASETTTGEKTAAPVAAKPAEEAFTTGVAKGRDRLDSAISTSALKGTEIEKFGARSLGEVLRNIPGIRVEYAVGEGHANFTVRGLPMSGAGSKYMQLQEDGMPVAEFGDQSRFGADMFMRMDLNVAQVEAIRGGSASTFASNSPGGVINLLSKTGDVEGGAVQTTLGINYGEYRVDGDFGHKLSDTLRFHIGGFYRQGEGPRNMGFDAYRGGQVKFNVTKTFSNGYVRVYGKYLNDITPQNQAIPLRVSGTNADPDFSNLPGFDVKRDSLYSRYNFNIFGIDNQNNRKRADMRDGSRALVKSIGFDSQFDIGGWTVSNKFRFADMSGNANQNTPSSATPASAIVLSNGGPGARLSYANGPLAGQTITNPADLNGNGLLAETLFINRTADSLNNTTNDFRVSRVWRVNNGNLTTTAGFYKSSQDYKVDWLSGTVLSDVRGGGDAALVNITTAGGQAVTQDGYLFFYWPNGNLQRTYDMNYGVNAPYGSVNYHIGKIAIGGSVRYDLGRVNGTLFGASLGGGRAALAPIDVNGDGQLSRPEQQVAILPLSRPGNVDYNYGYLSYSGGINFRITEPLAVFGRYSRGGRAAADQILFTPAIDYNSGALFNEESGFDVIKQAEIGLKFRKNGITANVTAFQAKTSEHNSQLGSNAAGTPVLIDIVRSYNAKGVEFEAGVQYGVFSVTAGATYTDSKITADLGNAARVGNTPRRQPDLLFQATPQIELENVTFGANFIGTTSSFAQDVNSLTLPGYTLVNAFLQVRPTDRIQLMLNVNNLFDTLAFADITQGAIPASGIILGRAYNGRTASGTIRFAF